jgi:plasmid stability protein
VTERVAINDIIDYIDVMPSDGLTNASITIRKLDPALKERLRVRAAEHGHSMEAEARAILQTVLTQRDPKPVQNLYERIRARFETLGGADDLIVPPREVDRDPPRFA